MDLTQGYAFLMDRALKRVQIAYLRTFKKHNIGLTIEQWVILHRIYMLGENVAQAEITKANYRDKAATSKVILGLKNKGLILKDRFEDDQKRFKLVITEKGHQLIKKTLPLVKDLRKVGSANISDAEFEVFTKVVNQIWENYDEMPD